MDGFHSFRSRHHANILECFLLGNQQRVDYQSICQRLEPRFTRDLRASAPFRFEGKIQVFDGLFGRGPLKTRAQGVGELSLFLNGSQHGRTPLLQLTQIAQALFQRPELRIVKIACRLLPIPRNKWNRRTVIEQGHRRGDLRTSDAKLLGDGRNDLALHHIGCNEGYAGRLSHHRDHTPIFPNTESVRALWVVKGKAIIVRRRTVRVREDRTRQENDPWISVKGFRMRQTTVLPGNGSPCRHQTACDEGSH